MGETLNNRDSDKEFRNWAFILGGSVYETVKKIKNERPSIGKIFGDYLPAVMLTESTKIAAYSLITAATYVGITGLIDKIN